MSLSGSAAAKNSHTRFGSRWTRKVSKLRGIVPIDRDRLDDLLAASRRDADDAFAVQGRARRRRRR